MRTSVSSILQISTEILQLQRPMTSGILLVGKDYKFYTKTLSAKAAPRSISESYATVPRANSKYSRSILYSGFRSVHTWLSKRAHSAATYEQPFVKEKAEDETMSANEVDVVEPPHQCLWHHAHVNSVQLIGQVVSQPLVRRLQSGTAVAHVTLGVLPRHGNRRRSRDLIKVDFWDYQALQIESHIEKGMDLAVGGRLKRDSWTDNTGQEKSVLKVVSEYFLIVQKGAGTLVSGNEGSEDEPTGSSASSGERDWSTESQTNRNAMGGSPSPRAVQAYEIWREDPSMTWGALGLKMGIKAATAIGLLGEYACKGGDADLTRLASQLQIGSQGMPWMTVKDLNSAIEKAQAAAAQAGVSQDPKRLRLKPIRQILEEGHETGVKLAAQEDLPDLIGQAITYNQIKLAIACKAGSIDLESYVTATPQSLSELTSGGIDSSLDPPF